MKKALIAIGLAALVSSSQAQGLINFLNSSTTLVTVSSNGVSLGTTPVTLGGYKYELFSAPAGTATASAFLASGLIATNTAQAGGGRFIGGNGVAIPGRALGGTCAILIRGWSANLGNTYAEALANQNALGGYLGESAIALNFLLGGDGGAGNVPTSPAFGGSSGIQGGFVLNWGGGVIVPEPSSMVLAGLGAASLLFFRRRK
jgi:hypothetical protein